MAQDRIDLCIPATSIDEVSLKRVFRYIKGRPKSILRFDWQPNSNDYYSLTDSDWATDLRTRRSTSGGITLRGRHLLSFWSKLQGGVALSSGEAELTSLTKGASELFCITNMINGLTGSHLVGTCKCDSSAARGTAQRVGVGQLKHVEV